MLPVGLPDSQRGDGGGGALKTMCLFSKRQFKYPVAVVKFLGDRV